MVRGAFSRLPLAGGMQESDVVDVPVIFLPLKLRCALAVFLGVVVLGSCVRVGPP
jgi:hypothetical protein